MTSNNFESYICLFNYTKRSYLAKSQSSIIILAADHKKCAITFPVSKLISIPFPLKICTIKITNTIILQHLNRKISFAFYNSLLLLLYFSLALPRILSWFLVVGTNCYDFRASDCKDENGGATKNHLV